MTPDQIKYFEVRDAGTFIPVMVVRADTHDRNEAHWLLRRSGFRDHVYYFVWHLQTGEARSDAYEWSSNTMRSAHLHVEQAWDDLVDGQVIDVEFLNGLRTEPKVSERIAFASTTF